MNGPRKGSQLTRGFTVCGKRMLPAAVAILSLLHFVDGQWLMSLCLFVYFSFLNRDGWRGGEGGGKVNASFIEMVFGYSFFFLFSGNATGARYR